MPTTRRFALPLSALALLVTLVMLLTRTPVVAQSPGPYKVLEANRDTSATEATLNDMQKKGYDYVGSSPLSSGSTAIVFKKR